MLHLDHANKMLRMSTKDFNALTGMLNHPEHFSDEVFGFHAQQAIEKASKAW